MALSQENAKWFADTFTRIVDNVGQALLGKEDVVRLALTTMLASAARIRCGRRDYSHLNQVPGL